MQCGYLKSTSGGLYTDVITTLLNSTDRTSMLSTSETDEHSITEPALTKIALPYLAWGRSGTGTMPGMDGSVGLLQAEDVTMENSEKFS